MYTYQNYYGGDRCSPTFSAFTLEYWERSLFQRLSNLFRVDGLPEGSAGQVQTDRDAFLWGLFHCGFLVVFRTKQYGITFQPGTPYGIGLQYQPTGMTVASPYFSFDRPLIIGRECEVLKLTPDYQGIWDIVTKHARELQLNEIAIRQAELNARFTYAIAARDDKEASSIKAMMEKLTNGENYLIYNQNLKSRGTTTQEPQIPWAQFDRDLKKNFILPELLECRRTIVTDFYREIGVPVPAEKKERVNILEAETNQAEFFNRREVWKGCLIDTSKRVNRLYGTQLNFTFTDDTMEGGAGDAVQDSTAEPNQQRTVSNR